MTQQAPSGFDYVFAELTCPRCGHRSNESQIDLQTKVSAVRSDSGFRIGDPVPLLEDLTQAGYLPLQETSVPGLVSVLETWSCDNCGCGMLWARLDFDEGVLTRVVPTGLAEPELELAGFISPQALLLADLEDVPSLQALPPPELRKEITRLWKAWDEETRKGD